MITVVVKIVRKEKWVKTLFVLLGYMILDYIYAIVYHF